MSGRTVIDVSEIIERQKPGRFLVALVVVSWIITFFDGYDSDVIAYAAPYLATEYHLDRVMIGNIFGSLALIFTAIVISLIPHDMMYGPQAALIAESVRSVTSSPRSSPGVRRP